MNGFVAGIFFVLCNEVEKPMDEVVVFRRLQQKLSVQSRSKNMRHAMAVNYRNNWNEHFCMKSRLFIIHKEIL